MFKNFKFSIIIANYNGEKYLPVCLSSVFKTEYPEFEVIIIEDGSKDNGLGIINKFKKRKEFKLIINPKNLGLVISRNKAIKIAAGEILVFLDNDTRVDKNWLKGLNQTFNKNNMVGAAQCKIFDYKKEKIIQEIGMRLMPYTGFGTPLGRGQKDQGQFDNPEEIIALGAALAVRKEVAKKIGGFDSKLFHYTDDLDFSWRIWILGYKVVLSPNAKIFHYTKIHNPDYKIYFHLSKNSLRMIIKNYEFFNLIRFLPFAIIFNIIGAVNVLISRGSWQAILGFLMGLFWNITFLADSLQARSKVQNLRNVKDEEYFSKIMMTTNLLEIYKLYFNTAKKTKHLLKGVSNG